MNELIKLDAPELNVIEKSKADQIRATFAPMVELLTGFEEVYSQLMSIPIEEMTPELCAKYKRCRLDIGKVRIETSKLKDKQKEYIKLEDRAIMGVHNILIWAVKEKEDKLKEREDFFEIQEQKRLEKLQNDRAEKLSLYIEDAHQRDLAKLADDEFEALLGMKKKEYEDRLEAERKAEEERKEKDRLLKLKNERESKLKHYWQFVPDKHPPFEELDISEWDDFLAEMKNAKDSYDKKQEEIKKENARLIKEAEAEKERIAKIEEARKQKEEADRKVREEKERKEREAYEAKLRKEREDRERVERELKAKQEAEAKAKADQEAKIQAELNKGDSAKVEDLINELNSIKSKYTFKSQKNNKMFEDVKVLIDKVINYINK